MILERCAVATVSGDVFPDGHVVTEGNRIVAVGVLGPGRVHRRDGAALDDGPAAHAARSSGRPVAASGAIRSAARRTASMIFS